MPDPTDQDVSPNPAWISLRRREPSLLARGRTLGLFLRGMDNHLKAMNGVDAWAAEGHTRSHRYQAFIRIVRAWEGSGKLLFGLHLHRILRELDQIFPEQARYGVGQFFLPPDKGSLATLLAAWQSILPDAIVSVRSLQLSIDPLEASSTWGDTFFIDYFQTTQHSPE